MELIGEGRLRPWLGPAIRGALAWAVKEAVCRWPPLERDDRYKTCRGCQYLGDCAYGSTFEAEGTLSEGAPSGMADGQRAITIRPPFPVPEYGRLGDRLTLCATFLGERAAAAAEVINRALLESDRAFELGMDRVGFRLSAYLTEKDAPGALQQIEPEHLPASPEDCRGYVPAVRLDLITPLFLKEEPVEGGKARAVLKPTLGQLVRGCLRTVGRAFAAFGKGLDGRVDFAGLKKSAEAVPTQAAFWQPFRQRHHSTRQRQRYDLVGVTGGAVFGRVPLCLLPWLVWGGRLGIGEHRVTGAGCWEVTLLA